MSYRFDRDPATRQRDYIIIPRAPRWPTVATIQAHVADRFGVHLSEMTSARRAKEVARPRQVAMYLSKQLTPRSLPEIGRLFGKRDHTTVIHAVRRITELRAIDPALNEAIAEVEAQLCA